MSGELFYQSQDIPDVSSEDRWYDEDGINTEVGAVTSILPPRRVATDRPGRFAEGSHAFGLRIGVNRAQGEAADTPRKIEVHEHNLSVIRLGEHLPVPEKVVGKFTFVPRPPRNKNSSRLVELAQWGNPKSISGRWILGIGIAIVAVVVLPLTLISRINAPNSPRVDLEKNALKVQNQERVEGSQAIEILLGKQTEASRIFRSYLQAVQLDQVTLLTRENDSLKDALRKNWRPRDNLNLRNPSPDPVWTVEEVGGRSCGLLEGTFPDHSAFLAYFINDNGRLLLDWKATGAFGTATFAELEKNEGDSSEIRGEISSAEYYGSVWREAAYQSYRFISSDHETGIWVYARRGGDAEAALSPLLGKGEIIQDAPNAQKVTLCLERGPVGSLSNQWLVREMLHKGWVAP